MECPFGCSYEGEDLSDHFNVCPAKVCPECGSKDVFLIRADTLECLQCQHTWPKTQKAPPEKEEEDTWLIRDDVFLKVETEDGLALIEEPVETFVEDEEGES